MRDEIFYCSDIEQLKQELKDNGYYDEEEGVYTHGNLLTPIIYNGIETLSLVRNNKLDLSLFPSLTNLGTYDEMFADDEKHDIYKNVYPYDVPATYTDDEGNEVEYLKPKYIGRFA